MASTQTFDPARAGLRIAETPIARKPRRPSTRKIPRPRYANAVWYSFQQGHALEATVPVRAVDDTIRQLKTAARYLDRTEKPEVRVQISVEPELDADGKPTKRSVVKFLGHEPFLLGRRVSKVAAEDTGKPAEPQAGPRHRRTVAGTRQSAHARSKASLPRPVVGSVITSPQPLRPVHAVMEGLWCLCVSFSAAHTRLLMVIASEFPGLYHLLTPTETLGVSERASRGREISFGLLP